MKRLKMISLLVVTIMSVANAADKTVILKIGPIWPRELIGTDHSAAWDASVITGATIDRRLTIGGGVDFLWNYYSKETKIQNNTYRKEMQEKTFMFPISGYISLSPVPDLKVCPVLSGQLGLTTMYYTKDSLNNGKILNDTSYTDENGWYMGLYWKLALDAVVSLSENVGFFVGLDYQYSKPKKLGVEDKNKIVERNMSGIGMRAGLSVAL